MLFLGFNRFMTILDDDPFLAGRIFNGFVFLFLCPDPCVLFDMIRQSPTSLKRISLMTLSCHIPPLGPGMPRRLKSQAILCIGSPSKALCFISSKHSVFLDRFPALFYWGCNDKGRAPDHLSSFPISLRSFPSLQVFLN